MNGNSTRYLSNHASFARLGAALALASVPPADTGSAKTVTPEVVHPPVTSTDVFHVYNWKGPSGISGTAYLNYKTVARTLAEAQALTETKFGEAEDGRGALKVEPAGPNDTPFLCEQWLS